jgi:hypothetical protein
VTFEDSIIADHKQNSRSTVRYVRVNVKVTVQSMVVSGSDWQDYVQSCCNSGLMKKSL